MDPAPMEKAGFVKDPRFQAELQLLRKPNDSTNWKYLGAVYLLISVAGGVGVTAVEGLRTGSISWYLAVPCLVAAFFSLGAAQHQLTALAHEASHYILFRNRWLNDVASDLLCLFPVFSTTRQYRLQHLAHHQFVNDPERDPNLAQVSAAGHPLLDPMPRRKFWRMLLWFSTIVGLVRYILVQASHSAAYNRRNPYNIGIKNPSKIPGWIMAGGVLVFLFSLRIPLQRHDAFLLAWWPVVAIAVLLIALAALPKSFFKGGRFRPTVPVRYSLMLQAAYYISVVTVCAWITYTTGRVAALYVIGLWGGPMATVLPLLMLLRQWGQHGNSDRGWLTNTRVFFMHPIVRHSVFPFGQDYHLPHHLFATVPHYRLPALHRR
ncbi:MAG: fatty acid desaturase family protein, partial [Planctomycetia bacterium]